MNIKIARQIVTDLQQKADDISREALKIALEQLELALQDDPVETLQVSVSDFVDLAGKMG
jgi:hypothetical protein